MRLRWNSRDISIAVKAAKHTEGQDKKMRSLCHPNVVCFYGIITHGQENWILIEHAESLHEHLHKTHFNLEQSLLWARDISKGRKHLVVFYYIYMCHHDYYLCVFYCRTALPTSE